MDAAWLLRLCTAIDMPQEVTDRLLSDPLPPLRFSPDTPPEAWDDRLAAMDLAPDPDGLNLLAALLLSAEETWARFQTMGIGWNVFTETMACFSRFVREHMESFGRYGFDRSFWVPRQLTCRLFRIGLLEYELIGEDTLPQISLHIPSGDSLELPALRESWEEARAFLGETFPKWKDAPMVCRSWLLSPALKQLLPPSSRILKFQENFTITPLPQTGKGYLLWVFKRTDLPFDQLPENTSLQRRMKAYLLAGNKFPDARGVLDPDPFL